MEKGLHGGLGVSVRVRTWLAHTKYTCPAPSSSWLRVSPRVSVGPISFVSY